MISFLLPLPELTLVRLTGTTGSPHGEKDSSAIIEAKARMKIKTATVGCLLVY